MCSLRHARRPPDSGYLKVKLDILPHHDLVADFRNRANISVLRHNKSYRSGCHCTKTHHRPMARTEDCVITFSERSLRITGSIGNVHVARFVGDLYLDSEALHVPAMIYKHKPVYSA